MTALSDIASQIEGFASEILTKGEDELKVLINDAVEFGKEAAPIVEGLVGATFETAVSQFGPLASALVLSLAGAAGAGLTGSSKANLSATQLVQAAAKQGVALAAQDVTTLIKNSYVAVDNLLTAKLAPAATS